ncbi:hypothetical protein AX15_003214 [Amanita polypyramis BW_CC]|nr:hypothetical protein AX15_003214 [Amanita polypyramis BW_CC]
MVAMVGLQVATTPPHPPPTAGELARSTPLEVVIRQRVGRTAVKAICWTAALAEASVIIANQVRWWRLSHVILSFLVFENSPDRIRATPFFFLGTFLISLGGYIRYRCYKEMGSMFTFEMSIRQDHRLVTSGPYSIVRHPGYTGILCTATGFALWHLSTGSWVRECGALTSKPCQAVFWAHSLLASTICSGLISRIFKEDEALRGAFGETWEAWARDVPYKLIPGLY